MSHSRNQQQDEWRSQTASTVSPCATTPVVKQTSVLFSLGDETGIEEQKLLLQVPPVLPFALSVVDALGRRFNSTNKAIARFFMLPF